MSRTISGVPCCLALILLGVVPGSAEQIVETPREIPVAGDVDVVVVGGSGGAVAAACEAARQGARVFLLAPRPYLGTDMCSTLRLWLEEGERPESKLAVACFGSGRVTTPLTVKAAMDRALLAAGVRYLTGCYATDVLHDDEGQIAGVVMANRSGRQAIRAKVVVDATRRAAVARQAGAKFRPFVPGTHTFTRVVIGGDMRSGDGVSADKKKFTFDSVTKGKSYHLPVYEYTLRIDMEDNQLASFFQAENRARDMTYEEGSEMASEVLGYAPSDTIVGQRRLDTWPGAKEAGLEPFRPDAVPYLYVLSAYADLAGEVSQEVMRPLELMEIGTRIGRAAARESADRPRPATAVLAATGAADVVPGNVRENLAGIRSSEYGTVHSGSRGLPVLGRYDVVVVGGGTSGAPAGIGAAKRGAKTLVVEYLHELGGVGTVGLIGNYWYGLRRGYTRYVDERVNHGKSSWNAVEKAEWLRRELCHSGADVWFGTLACGALVRDAQAGGGRMRSEPTALAAGDEGVVVQPIRPEASAYGSRERLEAGAYGSRERPEASACGSRVGARLSVTVCGVVVATPQGRGVVLATTVIDATGNSDVAACAGAHTRYGISDRGSLNVQIAGFPQRPLRQSYVNTCYTMVADSDVLDVWHLMVWKRTASEKAAAFDMGQLVDSRERRRIVGDYTLTVPDILSRRTFPDTISQHYSNFDAAAFPDSPLLLVSNAKGPCFHTDLPYRCLLPQGLDGIFVIGLGASAQRDAMTLIRMQADLQNQGYAAGMAAAEAVRLDGHTRRIDIRALQARLVEEEVLDERVCTDRDAFPKSAAEIERAVQAVAEPDQSSRLAALAVIMAHPRQAIPLLRNRYQQSRSEPERLDAARILGILGQPAGAPALIAAVDACDRWDRGMALTSQRKTGNTFSALDRLVIALGFSGAPEAGPALVRKLAQLEPDSELSHYKAMALALRGYEGPAAADALEDLFDRPGFRGHAAVEPVDRRPDARGRDLAAVTDRYVTTGGDEQANRTNLNRAFKELIVAAMLYRCGDRHGKAEATLKQYVADIHGHFARYARWTLGMD